MSTAIVRLKGSKEIVGFYACEDSSALFNLVDQITSPYECEYMEIHNGGFHWPEPDSAIILSDEFLASDGEMDSPNFDGASADEYLLIDLMENDDWFDFTREDSGLFNEEE
jgi:hypothetical protein